MVVTFDRARESLQAAELCLREGFVNSATSRGYYAMFQAAQAALWVVHLGRAEWTHAALQAAFVTELIRRRKIYPGAFAEYLWSGLHARQLADYHADGVSRRVALRAVRRAVAFLSAVEKEVGRANQSAG
jgi:uncharacterized protein (UPF0332 family)